MNDKMIIIQLNEHDANRVLWLVQATATGGPIWNEYWARVAQEIHACIEAQQAGRFFQCAACTDPCPPESLT